MKRKQIVAGNWKMNHDLTQTRHLINQLKEQVHSSLAEVFIAPPFPNLYAACELLQGHHIKVMAQNIHYAPSGAYTGEVSAAMLKSLGIEWTILGHSERRLLFHEDNALLAKKVDTVIANEMNTIFCIGEELKDRKSKSHFKVVENQLAEGLFHLPAVAWEHIVLAYEPVWAIGTGETASPQQAQEMHARIREILAGKYGSEIAEGVSILYGGSVKPDNASEIFAMPDVDGGLIGGASLKANEFASIIAAI